MGRVAAQDKSRKGRTATGKAVLIGPDSSESSERNKVTWLFGSKMETAFLCFKSCP